MKLRRLHLLIDAPCDEFDLASYLKKYKHRRELKKIRNQYKRGQKRSQTEKHRAKEYSDQVNKGLNPFLLAVSCVDRVEVRCGLVRRLNTGETFSGKEFIRLCKNVGASQSEINLVARNLVKLRLISRQSSTKSLEIQFKAELLKFNHRVAGSKKENILSVGSGLGLSEDESYRIYKKLSTQESIERRQVRSAKPQ